MHLFVTGRETVDKADGVKCCVVSSSCLWNSIYDQFYRNLLSCIKSHPICYNGEWEIRLKDMNSEILGFLEFLCQTTFSFEDGRHCLCRLCLNFLDVNNRNNVLRCIGGRRRCKFNKALAVWVSSH